MADLYSPASPYGDPYGDRERDRAKSQRDALAELLSGGGKSRFFGMKADRPQPAISIQPSASGAPILPGTQMSGSLAGGINSAGNSLGDAFNQPNQSNLQFGNQSPGQGWSGGMFDDSGISPSDTKTGYDTVQTFRGQPTSTESLFGENWLSGLFGGGGGAAAGPGMLSAVPGGAGYGSATGGAASSMGVAAVPGGVSNAAVTGGASSGAGSGFLGGLFGGGGGAGGGAGAGGMGALGMAALPLAVFAIPMLAALHLSNKQHKELKTKRSLYTAEDKARIAKRLADNQQAYRDKVERDRRESNMYSDGGE